MEDNLLIVAQESGYWVIAMGDRISDPFLTCDDAIDCAVTMADRMRYAGEDTIVVVEDFNDEGALVVTMEAAEDFESTDDPRLTLH